MYVIYLDSTVIDNFHNDTRLYLIQPTANDKDTTQVSEPLRLPQNILDRTGHENSTVVHGAVINKLS